VIAGLHIDDQVADAHIGIQILRRDVDVLAAEYAIDPGEHTQLIAVNVQAAPLRDPLIAADAKIGHTDRPLRLLEEFRLRLHTFSF
jgi:hypothetical protein